MRANARRGARWLAGVWAVAVVLAAVVMAGPAQAAPAPFLHSSVAWTHSTVIVAAMNTAGDLYYWWQPDGTTTWNQELVAAGQDKWAEPSIAWTGSAVIIADTDSGGQVDYYYQTAGTRTWHEQRVAAAPKNFLYGQPTISWTGSTVIIAAEYESESGSGNAATSPTALDYWYQYAGTGTWHQQQVATGIGYTSAEPSIGWTGSTVIITDTDSSGNLDYWYQYAGTGTWHQQQVAPASAAGSSQYPQWSSPVISWTGSTVIIAAVDGDGGLHYLYQYAGTGTWHQQQVTADWAVTPNCPPAIAWTGRSVVLAGMSENGSLNFWWQAAGTGPWHEEHVASLTPGAEYPSMASAGPSVVITDSDGSSDGPFPAGNLDYWWQKDGTSGWNQQQVAAG